MSEQPYDTVELQLASSGSDLALALEAAQYARLIQPDDPENEEEAEAMVAFVEAFGDCTEVWESGHDDRQMLALGRLGERMEALERQGLYVHAGVTRGELSEPAQAPLPMPVAVVTITRSNLLTTTVLVPTDLAASGGGMTSH